MGLRGLRQTALMLGAAICGVGSSIAYFGVASGHATNSGAFGEFVRIAMPQAASIQPSVEAMIAEIAPSMPDDEASGRSVELAAVENPLGAVASAESPGEEKSAPPVVQAPSPQAPRLTSLAAVNYDLAGGAFSSNAIQTEKKILVEGAEQSRIKVRIDENSAIYLDAGALSALMPASRIPASDTGFVSFDQLRSEGVGVRYDAALDTIQLRPDGA